MTAPPSRGAPRRDASAPEAPGPEAPARIDRSPDASGGAARAPAGAPANPCQAHACSLCCHDTAMPLREADAARLARLGHAPAAFSRVEDGWLLLRNRGGACVFLRDGACSVYEHRPEGCRLYPLVWEEDAVQDAAQDMERGVEAPSGGRGKAALDDLCPWRAEFHPGLPERRRLDALVRVLVRERAARGGGGSASDRPGRGAPAGFK